jgi:DNA-binding NarL/FixJ family response regulator
VPSSDFPPLSVLVAEDSALFREGLVRILGDEGFDVVAAVPDAESLVTAWRQHRPDVVVTDIRMPPGMTDDGAAAAVAIRAESPGQPVVLLSQHIEVAEAMRLLTQGSLGYLLKDRVLDVGDFADAVRRVAKGGTALDPEVVTVLVARTSRHEGLEALSARELEVLSVVAEGRSNTAIASRLFVTERTVEAHMRSIFSKLGLDDAGDVNRRVLAVVRYLQSAPGHAAR